MKFLLLALLVAAAPAFAATKAKKEAVRSVASSDKWTCAGTEPFWDLTIDKKRVKFESPEPSDSREYLARPKITPTGSIPESYGFVMRGDGRGDKTDFFLSIRQNECNDGMSEKKFTHEIMYLDNVNGNERLYVGCCNNR